MSPLDRLPATRKIRLILACLCFACSAVSKAQAQPAAAAAPATTPATTPAVVGQEILIQFSPVQLLDMERFRMPLELHAAKQLELTAPFLSIVRQVSTKINDEVVVQGEVVRLENRQQQVSLEKAQALLQAAEAQLALAGDDKLQVALAEARLAAAKADVQLAEIALEQTSLRAPFAGTVQRIDVIPGQTVRPGEPVLTLIDSTKLTVEIPMNRHDAEVGANVTLKVEDDEAAAKVVTVLPLAPRFQPLRVLAESVVSAVVEIDNAGGKLAPGQAVYLSFVPRDPIAEVPSTAILPNPDGTSKVQVLRDGIVRNVAVQPLAGVGTSTAYTSGLFVPGDQVIYDRSHELADGMQLAKTPPAAEATGQAQRNRTGARGDYRPVDE